MLKVFNIYGGVGSMSIPSQELGMKVVGNFETRKYFYQTNDYTGETTFSRYFNAPMFADMEKAKIELGDDLKDLDIVFAHPACGANSPIRATSKERLLREGDNVRLGDMPKTAELICDLQPKFFVIDNLPPIVSFFTAKHWNDIFPGYDIFFEYISNYHYGNSQLKRRRLFIIGAKKEFKYVFQPGEAFGMHTTRDFIKGLPRDKPIFEKNHTFYNDNDPFYAWRIQQIFEDFPSMNVSNRPVTYGEFREFIQPWRIRQNFWYYNGKREYKKRPGYMKISEDIPCPTLNGGGVGASSHFWAETLNVVTVRERARFQGAPDEMVFLPLCEITEKTKMARILQQTSRFIPVEFVRYVTKQIHSYLDSTKSFDLGTNERYYDESTHSKQYINDAKQLYCSLKGYSNQKKACEMCGVYACEKNQHHTKLVPYNFHYFRQFYK